MSSSFIELLELASNSIEYWAGYISRSTTIEKDDARQDLLFYVYCEWAGIEPNGKKKKKPRKILTKYFIQKHIHYRSKNILRDYSKEDKNLDDRTIEFLDSVGELNDQRPLDPVEYVNSRDKFDKFVKSLTKEEKRLFDYYCYSRGKLITSRMIASKMKTTENKLAYMKYKLKNKVEEIYGPIN
jgi:hypothetical protein